MPGYGAVDGDPAKNLLRQPAHAPIAFVILVALRIAADLYVIGYMRTAHLPWAAEAQPVVGALDLLAAADELMKDAEFVADAVADGRNLQCRQRIHEARSKPAETAVTQPRLLFVGHE